MRIKDRIANRIIEKLEDEFNVKITKKDYLNAECMVADLIEKELSDWLRFDTDFNEISKD